MKIIHCADLHLDSKLNANLVGQKKRERKAELLNTFTRMVDYAVEHNVDAIIIAGDLFDTATISVTAQNTVKAAIVSHPSIAFYYLKGNHDADGFLEHLEMIPENLKLFNEMWTEYKLSEYVSLSGVELSRDNAGLIYGSLVLDNDKVNIVVLHGQEYAYQAKGKEVTINISDLKNKGIDYLALGHIHSYKQEKLDRRGVYCYSGCLEGRGFDECGEHGFVLLTVDEEKRSVSTEFVPFAKRRLHILEIDVTGCMETADISARIRNALDDKDIPSKDLVKLVLTGSVDVECEKDMNVLLKRFEDEFYFLKIYDETKLAIDFQAFCHDESLKGEFVRSVMNDDGLSLDMKTEIIRCGIFALAGEEIGESEAY